MEEWCDRCSTILVIFFCLSTSSCVSTDTLKSGESISGNQTVVSGGGVFALGFFSPNDSTSATYVGIWYNQIAARTIVWVANRAKPVTKGVLRFSSDGKNLVVVDADGTSVWTSDAFYRTDDNDTVAVLLDSGSLELRQGAHGGAVWTSFENPTDTFLPGMYMLADYAAEEGGTSNGITSWTDANDPAPGNFTFGLDADLPLRFMTKRGGEPYWRSLALTNANTDLLGSNWGSFISFLSYNLYDTSGLIANVTFNVSDQSTTLLRRYVLNHTGVVELLEWTDNNWSTIAAFPGIAFCDFYNRCGEFGFCNNETSSCSCRDGFKERGILEGGCIRENSLECDAKPARFTKILNLKLPDNAKFVSGYPNCSELCSEDCNCTAYAEMYYAQYNNLDQKISGCYTWSGGLVDMVKLNESIDTDEYQVDFHLRVANSSSKGGKSHKKTAIIVGVVVPVVVLYVTWRRWRRKRRERRKSSGNRDEQARRQGFDQEDKSLSFFDFQVLVAATDNFSDLNKIGQGGFGKVYKGKLEDGSQIAIKRLSRASGQGLEEFKNEVIVIAKLQHRNLVRLLGYCVHGEEKMLIYEYLPNKSLDSWLFGNGRGMLLGWEKRFNIIKGIARGLLYLHEDSRLRIIHRDLKAGNILLDEHMNPKISDFGMATIFEGNQDEASTARVVGTYGYMSPEYGMKGHFSVKSDVYSFGVLIIEIVSGQKSTNFQHSEFLSLLPYAWQLWTDKDITELVAPSLRGSCSMDDVSRCLHVALLCVQDRASDRPTMSSAIYMLENGFPMEGQLPARPTFSVEPEVEMDGLENEGVGIPLSINDMTISESHGR